MPRSEISALFRPHCCLVIVDAKFVSRRYDSSKQFVIQNYAALMKELVELELGFEDLDLSVVQ